MPYRDDYEIDFETLQAEVDFAYECGAHGIVFALVSEVLRLTLDERHEVAQFLVQANRNRGSVTISVGAESSFAAVQLARHAESAGATALMAIPPLSVALGESQLRAYYGTIINAVEIPVVVQDASAYIGQPMSVEFQASLLAEHGERIHFKPEAAPVGPVITALNAATQNRARIFEGSGGILLAENYRRGVAGTMPGTDLLDAVVALWRALEAGDEDRVYSLSPLVGAILALAVGLDGYLALEKHLMVRRGIFKNELVRGPVGFALDDAARAEVDRLFDRLQAVL
jgi:4-hydroxy-tetrahydrodipicolinate synthase